MKLLCRTEATVWQSRSAGNCTLLVIFCFAEGRDCGRSCWSNKKGEGIHHASLERHERTLRATADSPWTLRRASKFMSRNTGTGAPSDGTR
jgi:hypothetical protein